MTAAPGHPTRARPGPQPRSQQESQGGSQPPPGGRLYLGWQFATPVPDPGTPPPRPEEPERPRVSRDWLAAQRREEDLINRPAKFIAVAGAAAALGLATCTTAGWLSLAVGMPAFASCLLAAVASGCVIWRGQRVLRIMAAAEQRRIELFRADRDRLLVARQAEHAASTTEWQRQKTAFARQKRWYCLSVPDGIDRVDVAGGTLAGWSALLTMAGGHRLAAGGEVTVIDLSGGAVAGDLVGLADLLGLASNGAADGAGAGTEAGHAVNPGDARDAVDAGPAVWVLPRDLPRLDIAASLTGEELADVLALAVSVAEERGSARDLAIDTAILDRVIGALDGAGAAAGGPVAIGRVAAALRALAKVGDPWADVAAGLLTDPEISAVTALFGSGAADRVILDRALGLEAQLRTLAGTGSAAPAAASADGTRLRVVAVDRRASPQAARLFGGFAVAALTQLIERLPARHSQPSWEHTVCLLGAERLRDDILDRLTDACETTRTGLLLGYRSIPPPVRQRIGRGNAAVAFMRVGNAEEAKAASEQLGTEHRFVVSQLTETIGTSVTDTAGASYTSTAGDSVSAAVSTAQSKSANRGGGRSRSAGRGVLPVGDGSRSASTQHGTSWGTTDSVSLTAGISTSTTWGVSTSRATGDSESLARSLQRSRELVVEPSELQRLPVTAMIVSYAGPSGRHVLLADANPAIGGLPVATMTPLSEAIQASQTSQTNEAGQAAEAARAMRTVGRAGNG